MDDSARSCLDLAQGSGENLNLNQLSTKVNWCSYLFITGSEKLFNLKLLRKIKKFSSNLTNFPKVAFHLIFYICIFVVRFFWNPSELQFRKTWQIFKAPLTKVSIGFIDRSSDQAKQGPVTLTAGTNGLWTCESGILPYHQADAIDKLKANYPIFEDGNFKKLVEYMKPDDNKPTVAELEKYEL